MPYIENYVILYAQLIPYPYPCPHPYPYPYPRPCPSPHLHLHPYLQSSIFIFICICIHICTHIPHHLRANQKKKQKRGVSRSHNNVTLVHVHNSFLFISHLFCFLFSFQTGLIDIRKQKKARGASDGDIKQDRTQDRNRINTDRQTQIADRTDRQDGTEQDRTD